MKDMNTAVFITGLAICAVIGIVTLLLLQNPVFSGLCIVAASILYACSLEH